MYLKATLQEINAVKILIFVCLGLILLGLGGYLYWMTTPMYSIQEAGIAVARHDLEAFEKRVDIEQFVDNLIEDLLMKPASTTPGLTVLQRSTGEEALAFAKGSLRAQLINKIRSSIGSNGQEGRYTSHQPNLGPDAAIARDMPKAKDLQGFFQAAGRELGRETGKLKNETYMRLTACARQQPKTITGKLLGSPPQIVGFQAKLLIDEYGFTKDTFRGVTGWKTIKDEKGYPRSIVGFKFNSPKAGKEITVDIAMYPNNSFGDWRVFRIENIPELMMALNEDYEYQVHSLMTCSLAGVTSQAVNDEMRGLTNRIKQQVDTDSILNKLKLRFK